MQNVIYMQREQAALNIRVGAYYNIRPDNKIKVVKKDKDNYFLIRHQDNSIESICAIRLLEKIIETKSS